MKLHLPKLNKLTFALAVLGLMTSFGLAAIGPSAAALSGSEFNASKIIDDGVFFNSTSMSAADIQAFLNAKLPTCDTNGTQPYAGTTRSAYGASRGYPAPYTCLKDYSQTIPAKSADAYCSGSISGGNKSASQIIYDVAQACGVSPKVLLILLQKEQSLVTDDWPWSIQYRSATGFGCPDTAACDSTYYGYFNQVYNAARQYQRYVVQADYFNYAAGRTSFVSYQANAPDCGGTNLAIQNKATAGLYNYTPYQPNAAALANLYGTGDNCSAYGNRNFWRMFSDWFGTTQAPTLSAQPVWQSVYTDSSKATSLGWNATLVPNQTAYAVVVMKNTGNITWVRNTQTEARLATYSWGRRSDFCGGNWLINCTRPSSMSEQVVAPGQTATFNFPIKAPGQPELYNDSYGVVMDGLTVLNGAKMNFQTVVSAPTLSAQPVWQSVYTDSSKATSLGWNATLVPNQTAYAVVVMKNTGNITWTRTGSPSVSDTRLATYGPWGRRSDFCGGNWLINCTRPSGLQEASVAPGQVGTFEFPIRAPGQVGTYNEGFGLVVDGLSTFSSGAMNFQFTVK